MTVDTTTLEKMTKEVQEAIPMLRELVSKGQTYEKQSASDKEKMAKLETTLDKWEVKNQEIVKEQAEQKKRETELEERINLFEKQILRQNGSGVDLEKKKKAFEYMTEYAREGAQMNPEHMKYLRTDIGTDGGALLLPPELSTTILKKMEETSPIRSISRTRTITSSVFHQVVQKTEFEGIDGVGEGGTIPEGKLTYGYLDINVKKMSVLIPYTMESVTDTAFDIEQEFLIEAEKGFRKKEGYWFLNGTGNLTSKGILPNTDITVIPSKVANALTGDSLIDLTGEVKTGYTPLFTFNRKTLAAIRKMTDGQGRYLWTPSGSTGLAPGAPSEINGYPYVITPEMPDIAPNSTPVLYGDFMEGFLIVDKIGMTYLRNPYTEQAKDMVIFSLIKRLGSDVVQPEAFAKIKIALTV